MKKSKLSGKTVEKHLDKQQPKDYLAGWKRCKADFENYQKKVEVLLVEAKERTAEDFVLEIIPILNNFNLAIAHIPQSDRKNAWVEGIFHIKKQLEDTLKRAGVNEIKALGEKFDPVFHECLEEVTRGKKGKASKVVEVVEKGYCRGDKVIKAVKVKIGH